MRPSLALVALALLGGCLTQVHGDPPRKACGDDASPAHSAILGSEASWAGRSFTANEDGVRVWVAGGEGDAPDDQWWGHNAKAWAVVALRTGDAAEVVEARAGLIQYNDLRTTVHAGPGGQTLPNDGSMLAADKLIGPLTLGRGESLMLLGVADHAVSALGLQIRWTGCGETGSIVYGQADGFVAGWAELDGPLVLANGGLGTVAYQGHFERTTNSGIVLAQPPTGGDPSGQNEAKLQTSGGELRLEALTFLLHEGGPVTYDVTHVGETGKEPLVAFLPVDFAAF